MRSPAIVLAAAMLLGACASGTTSPTTLLTDPGPTDATPTTATSTTLPGDLASVGALEALERAQAIWAARAPADYTVLTTCPGCADEKVAVRSGELVSLDSRDLLTIDRVFAQIEDAIASGTDVDVRYADLEAMPGIKAGRFSGDAPGVVTEEEP